MTDNDEVLALEDEIKNISVPDSVFEEFTAYKVHDMFKKIVSLNFKNRELYAFSKITYKQHEELTYLLWPKYHRVNEYYYWRFGNIPGIVGSRSGIHEKINTEKDTAFMQIMHRMNIFVEYEHHDTLEFRKQIPEFKSEYKNRELEFR